MKPHKDTTYKEICPEYKEMMGNNYEVASSFCFTKGCKDCCNNWIDNHIKDDTQVIDTHFIL